MGLPGPLKGLMTAMHRPVYRARLEELVRRIRPHLREGDRVLDVGCGEGTLGKALMDAANGGAASRGAGLAAAEGHRIGPREGVNNEDAWPTVSAAADDAAERAATVASSGGSPERSVGVVVEGLERRARGGEPIRVIAYDGLEGGKGIPLADKSYDVVILADVLHHEPEPDRLIAECVRVSRRLVVIKDHQVKGPLARQRIAFMDWAANAPYGVPCLYRYNTPEEWRRARERHGLRVKEELDSMRLYPFGWNFVFGGGLQYLGVLEVGSS